MGMAYSKTEQVAMRLAEPIAQNAGCYIYDVEFVKEGGVWFLRIFADKEEGGITLNECEVISRALSDALDREAPIEKNYYLEVSSPGLDRPLKKEKDFIRYAGYDVEIKLYKPLNGTKQLEGELIGLTEDKKIKVVIDNNEVEFDKKDIALIKLAVKF